MALISQSYGTHKTVTLNPEACTATGLVESLAKFTAAEQLRMPNAYRM